MAVLRTMTPSALKMSDKDCYRLSNSNIIDIGSYLDGEHYPAYDSFTHKMLGQKSYMGQEPVPPSGRKWRSTTGYNIPFPGRSRTLLTTDGNRSSCWTSPHLRTYCWNSGPRQCWCGPSRCGSSLTGTARHQGDVAGTHRCHRDRSAGGLGVPGGV